MSYSGWKSLERRHAKRMKGERLWRPDYGDSAPDGQTLRDVWDCKYTIHSHAVATLFQKCEAKYKEWGMGRRFSLVLYAKKTRSLGDLVVLRADAYADLVEKEHELERLLAAAEGRHWAAIVSPMKGATCVCNDDLDGPAL